MPVLTTTLEVTLQICSTSKRGSEVEIRIELRVSLKNYLFIVGKKLKNQ